MQIFYGILHHNVGAPLELLETLLMTFQRFYLTQHSIQIQTESDSESKVLDLTTKRLSLESDVKKVWISLA